MKKKLSYSFLLIFLLFTILNCKQIKVRVNPVSPRQGDIVNITITAKNIRKVEQITYTINDIQGTTSNLPHIITLNTCKTTGKYITKINIHIDALLTDGKEEEYNKIYDLTKSKNIREDQTKTYALYKTEDMGDEELDTEVYQCMYSFITNFDSFTMDHLAFSEERMLLEESLDYLDSVDMAILFGHGMQAAYTAGDAIVPLKDTKYGGFASCEQTGDLEYLVFDSCDVLAMYYGSYSAGAEFYGGYDWNDDEYATCIAFGDVDGDGKDEIGVAAKKNTGYKIIIHKKEWYYDAQGNRRSDIFTAGSDWPGGVYATSIAFGDIDQDNMDEIGVTTSADSGSRFYIYDDSENNFALLYSGGNDWPDYTRGGCIAFGDINGDGADEIGITKNGAGYPNYFIYKYYPDTGVWSILYQGRTYGFGSHAIAFGNIDSDEMQEIAISCASAANDKPAFYIIDDGLHNYTLTHRGGWGWFESNNNPFFIAFGDVDNDGRDEIGVARMADGADPCFYIYDDRQGQFAELASGGSNWTDERTGAYYIAFGNVDEDPNDEIGVVRISTYWNDKRIFIYDDVDHNLNELYCEGENSMIWDNTNFATSIAFGNVNGDVKEEVGISRFVFNRDRYYVLSDSPDDNTAFGSRFWREWFYDEDTKFGTRPFSGLHMVLGFTTFHSVHINNTYFYKWFANNLDNNMSVIDAWMEAGCDAFCPSPSSNSNKNAVIYLKAYEDDTIQSNNDDYIFNNVNYCNQWIDYWE